MAPSSARSAVTAVLPIYQWLREYDPSWLRGDIVAGLTVAAAVIPEGMAYASLAGLPPETGLYASLFAVVAYLFVGSSRQVVYGPTSALAVLLATQVRGVGAGTPAEYATLVGLTTLLVGAVALVAWLLRLGFVVNFISESVLTGFATGTALFVVSTQLGKLVGIEGGDGTFYERVWAVVTNLASLQPETAALGGAGLAVLLVGERSAPRFPTALVVVALSTALVAVTDLTSRGVAVVGTVPSGIPSLSVPTGSTAAVTDLFPVALALFLLSYVEGMGAVETFARRHGYRADANQELLATGLTNLLAGLGGGFAVGGSMSRSALNDAVGARTQLTNGVIAVVIVVVLLFLSELLTTLPETILAAVVIVAVTGLVDVAGLRRLYRADRLEFLTAASALVGVLVFGVLYGVFIGVLISVLVVVGRATYPHTAELGRVPDGTEFGDRSRHPANERVPSVFVYRVDAELFFANAPTVRRDLLDRLDDRESAVGLVVFDLRSSPTVDLTAADMLSELHDDLAERGIDLRLAEADGAVRDVLAATDAADALSRFPVNESVSGVIDRWREGDATDAKE
ncbi:SulP family inorganic anion transporter [Haloarcula onubensis]|uniref:SulP family inorganic anion transporter n=1 Tax=Haloarcula onubensis TaxID=2950539 RepID=A0ABU2FJM8_9EURY|nr:SulP family inorganic anion transporter [Halomicroarcula sp. S3CR25-11]MDS0280959.1 SulP family inorganic anion transporter [Halomicroarcula sp. S3CR25-11]